MARRRYLVMYDIADDTRLRRVHTTAKTYGQALQFSVFVCDLNPAELTRLKWDMGEQIDHRADSVAIVDLGEVDRAGAVAFTFLGLPARLPGRGPAIL